MRQILATTIAVSLALSSTPGGSQPLVREPDPPQRLDEEWLDRAINRQDYFSAADDGRLTQEDLDRAIDGWRKPPAPTEQRLDAEWLDRAINRSLPPPQQTRQAELNLNQSLDAIVQSDSRGWASHTYDFGSMQGAHIRASSADGSTYVARGYYTYNGGRQGWIDAQVSNGRLVCIEYWNTWFGCRQPNGPGRNSYAGAIVAALVVAVLAVATMNAGGSDDEWAAADPPSGGGEGGPTGRRSTEKERPQFTPRQKPIGVIYSCPNPPCWDLARDGN